jgi:hypothetical protein
MAESGHSRRLPDRQTHRLHRNMRSVRQSAFLMIASMTDRRTPIAAMLASAIPLFWIDSLSGPALHVWP